MTTLDKAKFSKTLRIPALTVEGVRLNFLLTAVKQYLLKLEKFKPIQINDLNNKEKVTFLNPDLVTSFDSFAENTRTVLEMSGITASNLHFHMVKLTYENWKPHEIISAILPPPLSFSGFSIVGSIIHLNLRDELLPYKRVIAAVLLDKVKNCKTVVNKVKNIDNTYRNFEMEVLAGNRNLKTEVKENGCKFELDFGEVYWNSRLHEEHGRVVEKMNEGDVLYDVFCGVGPFAILAAKNGCEVLANDLNPKCIEWLQRNVEINKVSPSVTTFNKSGDNFIKEDLKEDFLNRIADTKYESSKFHVTMNLPSTSHTFLPAFLGLFNENELSGIKESHLPIVHVYCFMKNKEDPETEAKKLVEETLDKDISASIIEIFNVRNVAPNKEMIRISFTLTKEILKGKGSNKRPEAMDEPDPKKKKLDIVEEIAAEWDDCDSPVKRQKVD